MAYYGIETDGARRWMARRGGHNMLILDLKEDGVEVTGNRSRDRDAHQEEGVF